MSHRDVPGLADLADLVRRAGEVTHEIFRRGDAEVRHKADASPVTEADLASQEVLVAGLRALAPEVPIITEETAAAPWSERRTWSRVWLVDPLDGTREFVGGRGEFTINVALIDDGAPILGAVCAPVLGATWVGQVGTGAWRLDAQEAETRITAAPPADPVRVVASRSHRSPGVDAYLGHLETPCELVSMGSSLKFCRTAEGAADLYPRVGRTMEWDTAAADAVLRAAGGTVLDGACAPLRYNKEDLANPHFVALGGWGEGDEAAWRRPWERVIEAFGPRTVS